MKISYFDTERKSTMNKEQIFKKSTNEDSEAFIAFRKAIEEGEPMHIKPSSEGRFNKVPDQAFCDANAEETYVENIDLNDMRNNDNSDEKENEDMFEKNSFLRADGRIDVESTRAIGKGDSIGEENLNRTVPGTSFAGIVDSEEATTIRNAIDNDEPIYMDSTGVIVNPKKLKKAGTGATSLNDANLNTTVRGTSFAGIVDSEEATTIRNAIDNDEPIYMDSTGVIINPKKLKKAGAGTTSLNETGINSTVPGSEFAAQWYETNPALFEAEREGMKKHYPGAKLGFLKDGRAYWLLTLNISIDNKITPWTVMLVYDSDHPNNKDYGGSCKAFPLKPTIDEIKKRARNKGKLNVPHIIPKEMSPVDGPYLCTARRTDVEDGKNAISTAVTTASWTAKWAYFYEIGLCDSDVWTEFCKHHTV